MNSLKLVRPVLVGSLLALLAVGCGTGAEGAGAAAITNVPAVPGVAANGAPDPGRFLQRLDRDGDGRVTVAELPARMQEHSAEIDADHDGVITAPEMTAHAQQRREAHFASVDANHDNVITADEAGERQWNFLSRADADHDGRVTREELSTAHAAGPRGFGHHGRGGMGPDGEEGHGRGGMGRGAPPDPAQMITRLDRDGDGRVTVAELPPRMQEHSAEIDADHDGVITAPEMTAAFEARRAAHRAMRPQTPGEPSQGPAQQ